MGKESQTPGEIQSYLKSQGTSYPSARESQLLSAILDYLKVHPSVAWAERFNTGAHVIDETLRRKGALLDNYAGRLNAARSNRKLASKGSGLLGAVNSLLAQYYSIKSERSRFIKYAFVGCSDILGQLKDGRLLAIEVKTGKGKLSPEQSAFIENVVRYNGLGFVARSIDDVIEKLREDADA